MPDDQNPLKDWASLGNNMIWRSDGAVVYPLFQKPRSGPEKTKKPEKPKGPWLARHPVGGFLGRFPTTEAAVRAIDSVHPLVAEYDYHAPPKVEKLLEQLRGEPELIVGVTRSLAPLARHTVAAWERSSSFGGSMIRKTAAPVRLTAVVAHWKDLEDGKNLGYHTFPSPSQGVWRWRIWDHKQTSWRKGASHDMHEAMDQADETLSGLPDLILAEGRPTATRWRFMTTRSAGNLARYVWSDPSHHVARYAMLVSVNRVREEFGGGWSWTAYAAAARVPERMPSNQFKTRRAAKAAADAWLYDEGWALRTR